MTDELFIRKMRDVASRSEYDTSVTPFLTPAEQCEAFDSLPEYRSKLFFWGASRGAERRSAFFLPDWLADAHETGGSLVSPERESLFLSLCESGGIVPSEHVTSLSVTGSGFVKLGHRDWLGAALNLGIERSALGDIAVTSDKSCVIACTARIAPLLSDELVRVARDTVKTELFADSDFTTVREFEKSDITVSSMRFDCIVKALCRVSREEAQRLVSSGLCTLEWRECTEVSRTVAEGEAVSVRGFGKFMIDKITGSTKKDRIRLSVKKYV